MTLVISRPDSDPDFADLVSWLLVGDVAALPPLSSVLGSPCLIKQPVLDTLSDNGIWWIYARTGQGTSVHEE